MTRTALLAKLGRQLNKNSTLDSATEARMLDQVNNRHRMILSSPGCEGLRRRVATFTSVVDQALYALANAEDVREIRETTNDRTLGRRSLSAYRQRNPDPATNTGTPEAFVPVGYQQVAAQPSAAAELFVKSTSAGDTQVCYVEGATTGGHPRADTVTLTGVTAVSLDATITSWIRIDKFYLASAAAGVVTLHQTSGSGTELARIGIGQTAQRYLAFYLDPTPSEALTYDVDAEFAITDLAQATDEPWLPSDFHDLLITGGMIEELLHTDDARLLVCERQWKTRLGELKLKLARQAMDTGLGTRTSRLGPWVPGDAF